MTKSDFHQLLRRYKEGRCSIAEIQKIDAWFEKISDNDLELKEWERAHLKNRILSNIHPTLHSAKKSTSYGSYFFNLLKVAAGLSAIIFVWYFLVDPMAMKSPDKSSGIPLSMEVRECKNTTQRTLTVQLPDGSTVELAPEAEIFYPAKWNGEKREVHLVGEAFFEVEPDAQKPFYVYGGKIVTKVLGTSFSVNAPKDAERIEVSVRTGKVSVYEKEDAEKNSARSPLEVSGVILTPNEKVEYFVKEKHWVTSLVEKPKPLPFTSMEEQFVFSATPVKDIFGHIERSYDIDIIIENETSYSCTFTGDVSLMELYDMLEVICKSISATYEVKGTKILITGSGCG